MQSLFFSEYHAAVESVHLQRDMKSDRGSVCGLKSLSNWAILCVLFLVALLLFHDPFLLLWWPQDPAERTKPALQPLDMAPESIDDMFDGCRSEAASIIDLFGVFEWHFNRHFSFAWSVAERSAKKPAHKKVKDDHAIALYMYTKVKNIQRDFNKGVQTGKHKYNTHEFKLHYLYFYMTDAIRVLRLNKTACRTSYLRTRTHFDRDVNNTNMRFGAFTWTAMSKRSLSFNGDVSCFEINSCFGADISYYSATKQKGQMLIPPYEVFHITDVLTDDPWCTVVYKLQSSKTPKTDLNCKLDERELVKYFGGVSTDWHVSNRVWMMSACGVLLVLVSVVLIKHRQKAFVAAVLGALLLWVIILVLLRVLFKE
ncbi:ecto-ADP-ribosyltransferase 4-like [Notolabrus celidotus]|uniref:ecto-ADP-ribosyltransferase 4-like n=1 Tax=Notolabrus celidotus TaxID=1203425 RepID=UPI00148F4549|nr:ecto-ADP-ribosyltransferase 4-like [Notolabrus celidotus]